ncbi:hypothetical protein [Celeribacter naphthalenivorans]|uniref:hypothetical protein n=1 Tax=Celeribacter naphthalenivorans TaxID=1614694 RepID=UPI001CFA7EB4|nr:hypothetical protein [Celeribacter naphthalenivorans]
MPDKIDEIRLEWYRNNIQIAANLSNFALKTLVTLNSGAIVVLLTFIGNAATQSRFLVSASALKDAIFSYILGLIFVFLLIAVAYVNSMIMTPYDARKGLSDKIALPIYVIGAFMSLAAFVFGTLKVANSISIQ